MITKDLELYLEALAKQHKLPLPILIGVCLTESSGTWQATRFEKHYRWLWDVKQNKPFSVTAAQAKSVKAPAGFPGLEEGADAEWINQKTSWGPLQIMGAVARELGFKGRMSELWGPTGAEYGVKHFKNLHTRFFDKHSIAGVISAYNRGTPDPTKNPDYVRKVLDYAHQYERWSTR